MVKVFIDCFSIDCQLKVAGRLLHLQGSRHQSNCAHVVDALSHRERVGVRGYDMTPSSYPYPEGEGTKFHSVVRTIAALPR